MRIALIGMVVGLTAFSPFMVSANLVPCGSDGQPPCQACHVVALGNNILTWLVGIMTSIIALVFIWGGLKMVMSAGETGAVSEAKGMMTNAIIGLLILLASWLIINTIMKTFVKDTNFGPWNQIQCVADIVKTPDPKVVPVTSGGATGSSNVPFSETKMDSIMQAVTAYRGQSTAAGPGGGTQACVWAVNNILQASGIAPIGASDQNVYTMERELKAGRGTLVDQASAMPGDLVIVTETPTKAHVGICLDVGCKQTISNSSGKASFSWISDTSFSQSYNAGPGRIYRVTK